MANRLITFAGGASLGFIASRILPPLVSQTVASWNTARGHDPFQYLAEDHDRFRRLLAEMEESRGKGTFHRTQLLARLKRGLAAHAMAEEDVIYPLIHDEVGAEVAAERLYSETRHDQDPSLRAGTDHGRRGCLARSRRRPAPTARRPRQTRGGSGVPAPAGTARHDALARTARHIRREKAMML